MTDLMKSSWLKNYFVLFVSNLRNLHTTYGQLRFSLTFSFRCFTVLAFIFRSMTHFELIFLYTGVETDFSLYITVQSHQNICWKGYTLPIELPWNFVQKKKRKSIDHIEVSLFPDALFFSIDLFVPSYTVPHCLDYCRL